MHQSIPITGGLLCLEWVAPEVALLRVFVGALREIDAETGQPCQPFDWFFVLHLDGPRLWVKGAMHVPPQKLSREIFRAMTQIGAESIEWECWEGSHKRHHIFPLNRQTADAL